MSSLATEYFSRADLRRVRRGDLERLARYLKLNFEADWSQRHLANLVYWRLTRGKQRQQYG